MLKVLFLLCAASLPRSECTQETARAVLQGPDVVICWGIAPQALLASTAIRTEQGEYVLMLCERASA